MRFGYFLVFFRGGGWSWSKSRSAAPQGEKDVLIGTLVLLI